MIEMLQQTKDKPIELTILRDDKQFNVRLTPVLAKTEDPNEKRYRIGFGNQLQMKVTRLPFAAAVNRSLADNKKDSLLILELMKKLVERKVSIRTISGPIGIAQDAGEAAQAKGWTPLLMLSAAISLNLGIFNLLPIPILDGGVILLLLIEGFMRRDISLRIKERIYQAAFVFLVLFAVMVIYNDLAKTLPGWAGRLP
jgi:regulator of sigma E protease